MLRARSEHPCMCSAPGTALAASPPFQLLLLFAGFTPVPVINGLWLGWKTAQTEAFTNPLSLQQGHNSGSPSPWGMGGRSSCFGGGSSTDISPLMVNCYLGIIYLPLSSFRKKQTGCSAAPDTCSVHGMNTRVYPEKRNHLKGDQLKGLVCKCLHFGPSVSA